MKKWLVSVLFGAVLVLGACGGGDGGNDGNNNTSADPAEDIYKQSCASCHGSDLEGQVGPGLTDVGSEYSADDIEDIIENGKGDMQPVNMDDDDRATIAEWLAEKE